MRVRSVNGFGVVTAVRIDKPGIIYKNHEELGKTMVKDGHKYILTGLIHNAPRGDDCYTTLIWQWMEPIKKPRILIMDDEGYNKYL